MTLDELKAERAALSCAIEQRQKQIDQAATLAACAARDETRSYVDYTRDAPPVVTKSAPPTSAPQPACPFTPAQMAIIKPLTAAIGEKMAEERKRVAETQRQIREEMQEFVRREVDRMAQRLRNEALQERLDLERSFRVAEQQRSHRGASGLGVSEMIEINPRDVN